MPMNITLPAGVSQENFWDYCGTLMKNEVGRMMSEFINNADNLEFCPVLGHEFATHANESFVSVFQNAFGATDNRDFALTLDLTYTEGSDNIGHAVQALYETCHEAHMEKPTAAFVEDFVLKIICRQSRSMESWAEEMYKDVFDIDDMFEHIVNLRGGDDGHRRP